MYINKCSKCGAEFETKNPKRMICPNCLYSERSTEVVQEPAQISGAEYPNGYSSSASFGGNDDKPQRTYDRPRYDRSGSYNRYDRENGGYQRNYDNNRSNYGDRPQRSYNSGGYQQRSYDNNRSSYGDRPQRSYNNGGYQQRSYDNNRSNYGDRPRFNNNRNSYGDRPQRSFNRNNFSNRRGGFNNKRPVQKNKQLLISKEQLEQIEIIYKKALPLPNHDIHEVIGAALGIEPRKVFFGINLVRQKMMLPKLAFPKRKLAVTPDQLTAIKMLYEPLLPVPPIGCHKLISSQLKMDEWRVHVGIGLIRKQMGLERWNPDRPDAPKEFKK
ncbi:MAG: hypothetical protein ACI37T_09570 [Candidatus Gastranaerophilaceae bacterium]